MKPAPLLLLLMAGCDLFGTVRPSGRPVHEAYGGGHELRVLDIDSPLRARKKVPVLSTPEVFAVYVPSHTERDLLIGEHWLFFKLKEAEWFVEKLQDPDPPTTGDAPVEHLKPLRELDWGKVVIPHKGSP
jgi:hypothetical protein